MIKGIAHICFIVRDLEATIKFYCDILGFNLAFDYVDEQGKLIGAYLHTGDRNFIELFERTPSPKAEKQAYQHLSLEVDNMEKTVAHLKSRGIEVTEIGRGGENSWIARFADPEGNKIELQEYTPESRQELWFKTGKLFH